MNKVILSLIAASLIGLSCTQKPKTFVGACFYFIDTNRVYRVTKVYGPRVLQATARFGEIYLIRLKQDNVLYDDRVLSVSCDLLEDQYR